MEAVAGVMARHLETMRNKHAITLEHLRMGALKGQILDADGSVIYDLVAEFGLTPQSIAFDLGTATTNVKAKCYELSRRIEDGLKGEFMTAIHVLCSPSGSPPSPPTARWRRPTRTGSRVRSSSTTCAPASASPGSPSRSTAARRRSDGNTRRFIAAGEAHAFPVGTLDTFATYFAPADFNETVNTLGQPLYAKQEPRKFDRGTDLHTQSNPLPMCHRPGVLVKLTA